jgi:hypothetical protein
MEGYLDEQNGSGAQLLFCPSYADHSVIKIQWVKMVHY